jgi:post-segregation antitoxin (ccd killing protein)
MAIRPETQARNERICAYYQEGHKLGDVASHFKLGRPRVKQILVDAGVWVPYSRGDRTQFLGINVSGEVKSALKEFATERGISMSRLVSDTLEKAIETEIEAEAEAK